MKRLILAVALLSLATGAVGQVAPSETNLPQYTAFFKGQTPHDVSDLIEKACDARHFKTSRKGDERIECATGQLRFPKDGGLIAGRAPGEHPDHIDSLIFAVESAPDGAVVFARAVNYVEVPVSSPGFANTPAEQKRRAEVSNRMGWFLNQLGGISRAIAVRQPP
jgi:hypothetical protein